MEQIRSTCSAGQEISSHLSPKVNYHVHNGPALVPILYYINPVYTFISYFYIQSVTKLCTQNRLGCST